MVRQRADDGRELADVAVADAPSVSVEVVCEIACVQQRVEGALKRLGRQALERLGIVVAEVGHDRVNRPAGARGALLEDEGVDLAPRHALHLAADDVVVGGARDQALEAHAHGERLGRLGGREVVARVGRDEVGRREVGHRGELRAPVQAAVRAVRHEVDRELAGLARVGDVRLLGLLRARHGGERREERERGELHSSWTDGRDRAERERAERARMKEFSMKSGISRQPRAR